MPTARTYWWRTPDSADLNNVRFQHFDPAENPEKYIELYKKTWRAVHGNLAGFHPDYYLDAAMARYRADPDAVVTILRPDGALVGITELDTERDADAGLGWICLCFVEADCRRAQLGAQLIGHAVSKFRRLGRRAVRLCVCESNTGAIAFYEEYGFRAVGETRGVSTRLLIMEKEL